MTATLYEAKIPFGLCQQLPLAAFPKGKKRIRMRCDDFVKVDVRGENETVCIFPKEENGVWVPGFEQARNVREV
jgi:hypothetical protein